jgi:hypothetical protein
MIDLAILRNSEQHATEVSCTKPSVLRPSDLTAIECVSLNSPLFFARLLNY